MREIVHDFSRPLADAVKRARGEQDLTQLTVANKADIDVRTLKKIENDEGNPKLEVLYPLVRALHIDPKEIFYPELKRESPDLRKLRFLIEDCSEQEASCLISVVEAILSTLRNNRSTEIL